MLPGRRCGAMNKILRSFLLLTFLVCSATGVLQAQTIWTGSISTDWSDAGNWTAGVPIATSEVIIPNVTNDPIISTATGLAFNIQLQSGGLLTIATTGSLTINTTAADALWNMGTVVNNGIITIGNLLGPSDYGITNEGVFNNNAGARLNIDSIQVAAILNTGAFNNRGDITLGANNTPGGTGVENTGVMFNYAGGHINIDRTTGSAFVNNTGGNFINIGDLIIGASYECQSGPSNLQTFNNEAGGKIIIDRTISTGLLNYSGNFVNKGDITLGGNASAGYIGIMNSAYFENSTNSKINIDNVGYSAIINLAGGFNNYGVITAGASSTIPILIDNGGPFYNFTGGVLNGSGTISSTTYRGTGGTLSPGAPIGEIIFDADKNFSSTNLLIEIAGVGNPSINWDWVSVAGTATLGGDLTIATTPAFTLSPGQSFTILEANTGVTGTFASVTWPAGVTGTVIYGPTTVIISVLSVLPVTLIEFSGTAVGDKTALRWKTADEVNTSSFEIERSTNGINYKKIDVVKAIGNGGNNYYTTDEAPVAGNNYYRLKMKDVDGKFTLSQFVIVKWTAKDGIQLAPVPANSDVSVQLKDQSLLNQRAQVYNSVGNLITEVVLTNATRINVTGWAAGMYTLKTSTGSYRFMKQ